MRFSRTNMRLAAARLPDLSREIDAQAAEFSITHFCPRNPGLTKSTTYARETAKIGRSLFKSSLGPAPAMSPHVLGPFEPGTRSSWPNRVDMQPREPTAAAADRTRSGFQAPVSDAPGRAARPVHPQSAR